MHNSLSCVFTFMVCGRISIHHCGLKRMWKNHTTVDLVLQNFIYSKISINNVSAIR